jgi:hypothetical protein
MSNRVAYFIAQIYKDGGAEYGIYSEPNPSTVQTAKNVILDYTVGMDYQDAHDRLVTKINKSIDPPISTHVYVYKKSGYL